ncbi:GapS1 family protein [Pseudomonas rhizophila]|uniref:GapS1 family protein n=1 Tax=Pseudomonas rhizophila TaxID=2045200 RepID=UPI0030DC5C9F
MKKFEERVQNIQSKLRCYNALSILRCSLEYLYAPTKGKFGQVSKHPWLILLLIKWVYLDPLVNNPIRRPDISQQEMQEMLQCIYDLTDSGRMPNEYADVRLFMRALAYQQFFHQVKSGMSDVARQEILFAKVPKNHYFKTRFLKVSGLSVEIFLRLALSLIALIDRDGPVLKRTVFFELSSSFSPVEVDAFLRLISIEVSQLHQAVVGKDEDCRHPNEFLQQTFFLNFPLINVGSEYWCVSPHVLERSLAYFIYDFLKRDDLNKFNNPFGKAFEGYVGSWLGKSKLQVADEKELKKILAGEGKLVDFMAVDGNANVLIDAKGVEMSQAGMVALQRGDVRRATQTSLIKAFQQGHEVSHRLALLNDNHPVIRKRDTTYLLAVTYKELYVGNGMTLAKVVGRQELDKIRSSYSAQEFIPEDNIYFLTVHEFERLMCMVEAGKIGLVEALEKAKKADSDPRTQKFSFELHINEWAKTLGGEGEQPLRNVLRDMMDELLARLDS